MIQVDVHEAKTHLSRLIEQVLAGETVVITRAGEPVVQLVPAGALSPRVWGQDRGRVQLADDFDAALPAEVAAAFGDPSLFPGER